MRLAATASVVLCILPAVVWAQPRRAAPDPRAPDAEVGASLAEDAPVDRSAFLAWAAETLIPVEGFGTDAARLDPEALDALLEGKRFVFLGEPDHFIDEKYAFRLLFLEHLARRGWRHAGMEMGRSDGLAVDTFLTGERPAGLDEVSLYSGLGRMDPSGGAAAFVRREIAFTKALKATAGEEPWRWFGYDLDMLPDGAYHDLHVRLRPVPGAEDVRDELGHLIGRSADAEAAGLEQLLASLDADVGPLVDERTLEALRLDLSTLILSKRFVREALTAGRPLPREPFVWREEHMFALFDAYVDALPADTPVVLMGHNMHLSRSWEDAGFSDAQGGYVLWPTIGAHVTERFGDEVLAIWMLYDNGEHLTASVPMRVEAVETDAASLEHLLAQLPHEAFLLPLHTDDPRARWLDDRIDFRVNGGQGEGPLRRMTDALFFVRTVGAPRGE